MRKLHLRTTTAMFIFVASLYDITARKRNEKNSKEHHKRNYT